MAKQVNLKRFQNSSLGYKVNFTKNKIGIDITTFTVYFTAKINKEDLDSLAIINKKVSIHTDATNGKTLIEFSPSDTASLLGNYYWSISYKDSSDDTGDVLFYGRMTIQKTTRATRD